MNRHNSLFYVLDLTHDYDIPVIAAISVNSGETDIAMGFGANFDCLSAIKSAVQGDAAITRTKKDYRETNRSQRS